VAITKHRRAAELAKHVFEYAPAPEAIDHVKIEPHYGLFIGGKMVAGHSRKRFATINPATENKLSEVVEADEVDVDRAVRAADRAFDSWSRLAPAWRGQQGTSDRNTPAGFLVVPRQTSDRARVAFGFDRLDTKEFEQPTEQNSPRAGAGTVRRKGKRLPASARRGSFRPGRRKRRCRP